KVKRLFSLRVLEVGDQRGDFPAETFGRQVVPFPAGNFRGSFNTVKGGGVVLALVEVNASLHLGQEFFRRRPGRSVGRRGFKRLFQRIEVKVVIPPVAVVQELQGRALPL